MGHTLADTRPLLAEFGPCLANAGQCSAKFGRSWSAFDQTLPIWAKAWTVLTSGQLRSSPGSSWVALRELGRSATTGLCKAAHITRRAATWSGGRPGPSVVEIGPRTGGAWPEVDKCIPNTRVGVDGGSGGITQYLDVHASTGQLSPETIKLGASWAEVCAMSVNFGRIRAGFGRNLSELGLCQLGSSRIGRKSTKSGSSSADVDPSSTELDRNSARRRANSARSRPRLPESGPFSSHRPNLGRLGPVSSKFGPESAKFRRISATGVEFALKLVVSKAASADRSAEIQPWRDSSRPHCSRPHLRHPVTMCFRTSSPTLRGSDA